MNSRVLSSLLISAALIGGGALAVSAASAVAVASAARAETVFVDGRLAVAPSSIPRPSRGMRMARVEQQFGAPVRRHPTVGKPPITRWDYARFSVFFERNRVIDSVVTAPAGK